ncbi:MAG: Antilisterial bacteriocin subtilosin biosynthesis protein AlbA [Bacteroidetes bacterium ADurb.Bin408]|nr:MAG: Antilisterial bacteriocin subtilosin biosynthesis protein AlbA [Bacteroidetes bacterium ADurb.Bin408]
MGTSLKNHLLKRLFLLFKNYETRHHVLSYLFWECTTRCNLNCLHCGSDCSKSSLYEDMPLPDFLKAIDTIKTPHETITVVITGGEPLLRPDLEACGMALRKKGFRWGIVTNGLLYDRQRHNDLLNAGMGALTISLDGMAQNHNWLRNTPGLFDVADRAISLAASSKRLNFDVVTCVSKRNIGELETVYNYLLGKNVKAWRLFCIAPIGRARNNPELALSSEEFTLLMRFIAQKRTEKRMDVKFSCEGYLGTYENVARPGFFFCRAGINIASILIEGSISACPNINRSFVQGNIYNDNLYDVWQTRFTDFRNRSWTRIHQCKTCKDYKYCVGNGLHLHTNKTEPVLMCHKALVS